MRKLFIIIFILGMPQMICAQKYQLRERHFNFKGFATYITDYATDEAGNHLLVGSIEVIADKAQERDSTINRIFRLKGKPYKPTLGIVILTDKNLQIKKIARSHIGRKVVYDAKQKQFVIGAGFFSHIKVKGESFSAWQPVVIKIRLDLKQAFYYIRKPYSSLLKDIKIDGEDVLVFAESSVNREMFKKKRRAVDIFRVNTAQAKADSKYKWQKNLDIKQEWRTNHTETGGLKMSEVSYAEGNYYFTTTTLDQFKLQSTQHMYQLSNNKLTEIKNYALFLQLMTNHLKWIGVNGSWVRSKDYVVSLFHKATTTKEMIYTRTNLNFLTQHLKKTIKLNYYVDFNRFCVLSNGHTVILQHNASETWSYYFYDNEMTLLKEVQTKVSKDHVPYALFEPSKGVVSGVFNISNKYEKDCVVQEVRWKK